MDSINQSVLTEGASVADLIVMVLLLTVFRQMTALSSPLRRTLDIHLVNSR